MAIQRAPGTRPIFCGPDPDPVVDPEKEQLRSENEALKDELRQVRAVLKNASVQGTSRRRNDS